MPQPNGKLWRRCRARMGLTSDQAAQLLGIKGGSLRQIETNVKPASLALAFRAERLYGLTVDQLLLEDEDGKPEKKPKPEPKVEPVGPAPRKNGKGKGPRRGQSRAVA